jgi:hypothetical protein
MNTNKTLCLTLAGIIAIAITLLIIQLLTKKVRQKATAEGRYKISFAIWFCALFICASIIMQKVMFILNEALDNIYKLNSTAQFTNILKTGSLLLGFGATWLVIWYSVTNILSIVIVGKRLDGIEMEADNNGYFLIKGILLIGFILILSPIFEDVLRAFIPNIETPFYH